MVGATHAKMGEEANRGACKALIAEKDEQLKLLDVQHARRLASLLRQREKDLEKAQHEVMQLHKELLGQQAVTCGEVSKARRFHEEFAAACFRNTEQEAEITISKHRMAIRVRRLEEDAEAKGCQVQGLRRQLLQEARRVQDMEVLSWKASQARELDECGVQMEMQQLTAALRAQHAEEICSLEQHAFSASEQLHRESEQCAFQVAHTEAHWRKQCESLEAKLSEEAHEACECRALYQEYQTSVDILRKRLLASETEGLRLATSLGDAQAAYSIAQADFQQTRTAMEQSAAVLSAVARAAEQRADAAERSKDTSRAEATLLREQLSHVTERAQEHEAAAHQKAHEQLQYYICEHKGAQRHAEHLHAVQRSEHLKAAQHNEELMAALFCEELQAARCDADTMAAAKHRKEASDLRHKLTACCEEVTAFRAEAACMSDERRRILLEVRGLKEVELPQLRAGADERDRVAAELRRVQGVEVPCLLRDSRERERELLAEVATSKSQANTVEHELSRLRSEFDSLKEIHVVKLQEEVTQARSEAASVQQQCNQNKGELHTLTNFELPKWKSQAKEKEHLEVRLRNAHEVDIPNLKRMAGERESELRAEIASAREEAAQSVDEKSKLALELVNLKSVELPRLQRSVEENGRLARGIQGTRQGELDKLRLELHAKGLALQKTEAQLQTLNSQWSERYSCLNDALEAAGKQLSRLEVASAPGCCEAAAMSASLPHGASQFMGTVLGHLSAGAGNVDHVGPSTMSDTADDDLVQWALAQTGSNFSGLEDLRGAGPAGMSPTSSCIASFTGKASMPSPAASTHCREASPVGGALRHSSSLPISTSAGIEAVGRKAYSAHRDRGRTVQQRAVGKARPVQRLRG